MRRLHFSIFCLLFIGSRALVEAGPVRVGAASVGIFTVKKGDTLYSVARAHGLSVAQLRRLNNLGGDTINLGQQLRVGAAQAAGRKSGAQAKRLASAAKVSQLPRRPATRRPATASAKAAGHPSGSKSSAGRNGVYTVKAGDSVAKIASSHGLGPAQLRRWNHLRGDVLAAGQTLKVVAPTAPHRAAAKKVAAKKVAAKKGPAKPAGRKPQGVYTVTAGDNLGEISARYGVSVLALQTANRIQGTVINVGQKLRIPPRGAPGIPSLPRGMEARTIYTYVRVRPSQTPTAFASVYATTPATIRRLNALGTLNQIVPGAKLLVPSRMAVPVPPRPKRLATTFRQVTVNGVSVQVVQVDLRHRDVLVSPVLPGTGAHFDSGATVNSLTQLSGANALVNGSYFHPHTYAPAGDIVMEGRLLTWGRIPAALAITPDNRASITGSTTALSGKPLDETWNGMETVIASGPRIVRAGKVASGYSPVFRDPAVFGEAARSAIGLISSRDLLLVSTHARLTVGAMARIMAALGARDAVLLDGGSSAGISFNGATVLNSVRKVSYGIGVFTAYKGRRYAR